MHKRVHRKQGKTMTANSVNKYDLETTQDVDFNELEMLKIRHKCKVW